MRRLWILALMVGVILALAAMIAPQAALDQAVIALGLDRLTATAHPPLGRTARIALAVAALIVGLLLAALARRLARRHVALDGDMASAYAPLVAEPSAPVSFTPRFADTSPPEPVTAVFASAPTQVDDFAMPEDTATMIEDPPSNAAAAAISEPASLDPVGTAETSPLDRIEAAVARLEARGSGQMDAIDARLRQMAQQIAELAALARAPAAQPTTTSAQPRLPADDDQRRSIGAAARALRASLDTGTG